MLAALVDQEDLIVEVLPVATPTDVAQLNQRAQDAGSGYEWHELSAFEQGLLIGLTLPIMAQVRPEVK